MVTPFKQNGALDKKALREVVSFLKKRVHGLFVNGTYGCGPLMSVNERKDVLEIVTEEAGNDIQVCVHIGSTSNRDAFIIFDYPDTNDKYQIGYAMVYPGGKTGGHVHEDDQYIYSIKFFYGFIYQISYIFLITDICLHN
ncbi:unnamed protein product [marine sediment metagenome]|uniref:Uncharacterized protein n=1 Tax=marine sediment metagenome TaxID=412755 RepID=X1AEY6_9ZZZZ